MTLQDILKEIKAKTGLSNDAIARNLNVSRSTVARWANGSTQNLQNETLKSLSDLLGYDVTNIMIEDSFHFKRPILGVVKAGYNLLAEQNIAGYIEVNEEDYKRGDFFLRVSGDSMEGVHIHDNDLLYVSKCDDVTSGSIAVVMIGDEVTVKRLIKHDKMIILEAANPKYENRYFSEKDVASLPLKIIGKVLYSRTEF